MGSYLAVLRKDHHHEVRYPVFIRRQEHWDGVSPQGQEPEPIWLPRTGDLADGDCYVPAGWFLSGDDDEAPASLPLRRVWVDAFVAQRFPLINQRYIASTMS